MLPMEEFSCQSTMERTCGQYCSSQSMGRELMHGDVDDIGLFTPLLK